MTQALYNKWRPQKWEEIIGQQHVVQTLRNAVAGNRVVHAYLFAGPRGTGKTTAARLLAKAVNCLDEDPSARPCNKCAHCIAVNENRFLDLIEIDAASNTSVDDVRALRDKINFSPNEGTYKVYIIDEVHMLSTQAFNALLKTLEEPPAHAIFILATTEMHKIPATVLSRCQRYEFRRLSMDDIVGQLKNIASNEKLTAEPEALTLIARQSSGGMRDAISLLDQMASSGQEITLGMTQIVLGTATNQTVLDMFRAVLEHNPSGGINSIHAALDAGTDPRLLARQVVDYLRELLLIQMGNTAQVDLAADTRDQAERHATAFSHVDVLRMIKAFNEAAVDLRGGWQPSLPLELALAEVMDFPANVKQPDPKPGTKPALPQQKTAQVLYQSNSPAHPARSEQKEKNEKPEEKSKGKEEIKGAGSATIAQPETSANFAQINKSWKQIKESLRSHTSLVGLLNSSHLLEIKDGVLLIGFASEVLCKKMEVPEQMDLTRKAIADVSGVNLPIRCVISNAKQTTPADVKSDGMVAAALKKGGEIVDIQE
jgi:DNA polymerase-3 subunit gamma/tau